MKQILTYLCSLIVAALIAVPTQAETVVAVDIQPGSCPNPRNVESRGVWPVAILGSANFDVTAIDIPTVKLEGVAPLRWAYKDVATPFEPFLELAT